MIPVMDHPLSRRWEQPSLDDILLDETHALMTQATFDALREYSCSQPTGVYPGKMWKRHNGLYDPRCRPADRHWLLCWYDVSEKGPEYCSTKFRRIIVIDGDERST
jgi:hypothetical protein